MTNRKRDTQAILHDHPELEQPMPPIPGWMGQLAQMEKQAGVTAPIDETAVPNLSPIGMPKKENP